MSLWAQGCLLACLLPPAAKTPGGASLHLERIAISNFRAIENLELEFSPGLNVLVGENNVGKTTVLDALRACLGAAAAGSDAIRLSPDDRRIGPDGLPVLHPISVDVYFSGLDLDDQAEFIDALNFDQEAPERSTVSVHFRWTFADDTRRYHVRRWGGDRPEAEAPIPDDVLQGLPLTLLAALRDAVTALAPGRQSRLGRLLDASASPEDRLAIEAIAKDANESLDANPLILRAAQHISRALHGASGRTFAQTAQIQTSEPDFERIVGALHLMFGTPGADAAGGLARPMPLKSNGLGFNNLLYIGTVMAELQATPAAQATLPLLLVEEPEAHLHPQLQTLLATYLAEAKPEGGDRPRVQTIVTTHSPTIAAHVPADTLRVLHRSSDGRHRSVSLARCGLDEREAGQLRRMFDVTRATLLFARGVVLVEGVAEQLLLPVLARRLGYSLEESGVSVIQVCGVDFRTIAKLFGPGRLEMPAAIITDGDPGVTRPKDDEGWEKATPKLDQHGAIRTCGRTLALMRDFHTNPVIQVFRSSVTLEHALADAGPGNPEVMCRAWTSCFSGEPETFNQAKLDACGTHEDRVLAVWRGICVASPSVGKGAFAQALADVLTPALDADPAALKEEFAVPDYIERAIEHALGLAQVGAVPQHVPAVVPAPVA